MGVSVHSNIYCNNTISAKIKGSNLFVNFINSATVPATYGRNGCISMKTKNLFISAGILFAMVFSPAAVFADHSDIHIIYELQSQLASIQQALYDLIAMKPAEPPGQIKKTAPAPTVVPAQPAKPAVPATPAQPAVPIKPVKPRQSSGLVFPAKPATPAQPAVPAISVTPVERQAAVEKIQAQVQTVQQKLVELKKKIAEQASLPSASVIEASGLKLERSLQSGSSGDDVKHLQGFLKQFPDIYPEGLVTGYYGPLTEAAVKKFQEKHGVDAIGIVGPRTIAKLNEFASGNCTLTEIRPCYDRQAGNNTFVMNPNSGNNAFTACTNNASESQMGESIQKTAVCDEEKVQYCFEGRSQNFVRKFEGTCQPKPTPPPPAPAPAPEPTPLPPPPPPPPTPPPPPSPSPIPTTTAVTLPLVTVRTPNGGETWVQGFKGPVFWVADTANSVNINLLKGGVFDRILATNVPAKKFSGYNFQNLYPDAYHAWVSVPADTAEASDYTLEIIDATNSAVRDTSDAVFRVVPFYSPVTVVGRFIDRVNQSPLANVFLGGYDSLGNYTSSYTNANGEFSLTSTITGIVENNAKSLFGTWPACYKSQGVGWFNYLDAIYGNFNEFDLVREGKTVPVWSPMVDLGDIKFWPAVTFNLNSDIPVKFSIAFPEEGTGSGNSLYKTAHSSSNVLPLNYNIQVKLTDQSGIIYAAPVLNLPLDHGCAPVTLNFFGGQFEWK